jgi:hypothetical protein
MSQDTIEARVSRLEEQVSHLMHARQDDDQPAVDAWERTVGMFRGDPIVGEMIEGTRRIREEDRRRAREAAEVDAE